MINPTKADLGRGVIYHGYAGERERGVISSFNDLYVFVRYGVGCTAAATKREQLKWELGGDKPDTLSQARLDSLKLIECGHDGPVLWGAWLCEHGYIRAASPRNGHWMLTPAGAEALEAMRSKQAAADD